ncbi:hypothetical protein JMJ77_0004751 [Colletotrichum scovillei]|uniref:Uncharacterized protein n=1 Tax=Colletotrichum scovillei TaxID=1209932 RepID=A0A9P7RI73_9PEZI|nr:hypothetical protein JMJ77_0004751 [Colletotrichum scovillei]KAG7075958.1 hypothetical protein JMJ76_0013231 [Colletotrichum scovillei]KAG7083102.1 hypothetical protein JMJ78_0008552 [Colletotrichum scovillei]
MICEDSASDYSGATEVACTHPLLLAMFVKRLPKIKRESRVPAAHSGLTALSTMFSFQRGGTPADHCREIYILPHEHNLISGRCIFPSISNVSIARLQLG